MAARVEPRPERTLGWFLRNRLARSPIRPLDLGLLALLVAAVVGLAALYVSLERVYYWSDYVGYQELTSTKTAEFLDAPLRAAYLTWRSSGDDYGQLPTLPLVPWTIAFGDGRTAYVVGLAVLYLVPFALVVGALAGRIVTARPRGAFWLAAWLTVATPAIVVPTLRGYPDTGGATLLGLALLIAIARSRLGWSALIVGGLISTSVVFRRHFAYPALALLVALTVFALVRAARARGRSPVIGAVAGAASTAGSTGPPSVVRDLGLLFVGAGGSLVVLGLPFLRRVVTTDFAELYASYEVSPADVIGSFGTAFGWVPASLALTGLAVALRRRALRGTAPVAVWLWGALTLAAWSLVVRQLGEQYSLHFAIPYVVGLVALGFAALGRLPVALRVPAGAAAIVLAAANLVVGLAPLGGPVVATAAPPSSLMVARSLLASSQPPLRHPDYDGMQRLVETLRSIAAPADSIYVAASSDVLGCSILRSADRAIRGPGAPLGVLPCVHIDSRDEYPLEKLLWADFVVVASPFQRHLAPDRQTVVRSVVDAFTTGWPIARDFVMAAEPLRLASGDPTDPWVTVTIHRRLRPTDPETAIETLETLVARTPVRPGGQRRWVSLRDDRPLGIVNDPLSGADRLTVPPSSDDWTFLAIDARSGGAALTGIVRGSANCAAPRLHLAAVGRAGRTLAEKSAGPGPSGAEPSAFRIELAAPGPWYPLLSVTPGGVACGWIIDDLRMEDAGP